MKSRKSYVYLFSLIIALFLGISKANANEDGVVAFKFDASGHGVLSGRIYWRIVQPKGGKPTTTFWVGKDVDGVAPEKVVQVSEVEISKTELRSLDGFSMSVSNFDLTKYQPYSYGQESIRIIFDEGERAVILDAGGAAKGKATGFEYFIVDYVDGAENDFVKVRSTPQKPGSRKLRLMPPEIPMKPVVKPDAVGNE